MLSSNRRVLDQKQVKKPLNLFRLDPYLDSVGTLRVGGRIKGGQTLEVQNPCILPKTSQSIISLRIIEHFHREVEHCGRTTTVNKIRCEGYWIVAVNGSVKKLIHHCTRCRFLRGYFCSQKMADLPELRTTAMAPFTCCGVDMFGTFYVKERRSQVKRYAALFTCFASRAVHIEVTNELSTDSFINALRRFIARRGAARFIYSDNGTNFVGAERELREAMAQMNQDKIKEFLLSEQCEYLVWERNPLYASHMGGVWERMIRSVRKIFNALLKDNSCRLDDECLRTFMCEAESIMNSRPLTCEFLGDCSMLPLSPNQILTMKSKVSITPPQEFQQADVYCRKRWRRVQYLANQFWSRWKTEYLTGLTTRNKWSRERRNLQVGDVVLINEDGLPRNLWPLGLVSKVKSSSDGLVRSVTLRVANSERYIHRPVHKLVLLVASDDEERSWRGSVV